ncbi:LuxR family transcriptional regulator [Sphingomonas sp. URHD0057]|uniref:LuxR family transcriptional regulator n=1 Tax=Sphingomonas sp. URHD0057 TaxID=1380389 RepID=UPI00048D1AD6|nr:LuxR family transcriptional regulator [Sphingomonas sp. URHD0057]
MFSRVDAFVRDVRELETEEALAGALADVSRDLGFRYFALTHHVDVRRSSAAIRIHNYPDGWAEWFDEQSLGATDPVHRASNMTSVGFTWSMLPDMIALTAQDRRILELARSEGLGEGFTVPAHVPGEAHGSCSFACAVGDPPFGEHLPLLQLVGAFAFEAARRMRRSRFSQGPIQLTDRQRECVMWAARGKSDWEIARILGVSEATVGEHLRHAYERYGVGKRTLVAIHALFDGTIGFLDVLRR